jgi:ribosomal protein S18 acetylase RimI-like enzyme
MQQPSDEFSLDQVVVRRAAREDAARIRGLFANGRAEGAFAANDAGDDIQYLEASYLEDAGSSLWLAVHGGEVIAMIGVRRHSDSVAEIRRLRVEPGFRRRGVGRRLLAEAVAFCRNHDYLKTILDVQTDAEPAIRLFESFGFTLARKRDVEGGVRLEFYLDLYREPEQSTS